MPNDAIPVPASHVAAVQYIYSSYGQTHSIYSDESTVSAGPSKHQKYIVEHFFPEKKDAQILEVGCGDGRLVEAAKRSGYNNIVGIDASASMIELARKRLSIAELIPTDKLHLANAVSYIETQKPGSIDLIVAIDVVEHLQLHEIIGFFSAAHTVLSPGGQVLIQVPNGASPFHGLILHGDLTHYRAFTDKSVHQIARIAGFQTVKTIESAPVPSGLKSTLRALLWKLVRIPAVVSLAIETGQIRGHILTINLFSVMTK